MLPELAKLDAETKAKKLKRKEDLICKAKRGGIVGSIVMSIITLTIGFLYCKTFTREQLSVAIPLFVVLSLLLSAETTMFQTRVNALLELVLERDSEAK